MAIAFPFGGCARTPPSYPVKENALRLPVTIVSDSAKHSPATSRLTRIISIQALVLLSLLTVIVFATRNISICYSGWAWHYTHRCIAGAEHPWADIPLLDASSQSPSMPSSSSSSSSSSSKQTFSSSSESVGSSSSSSSTSTDHSTSKANPKIAIAMVIDDFLDPELRNQTIKNKVDYARKWGYHPFIPDIQQVRDYVPGLPVAWGKFPVIKNLLKKYDYVLMIDADAVILRDDIGLHAATRQMEREGTSLLISNDLNGPNSGVFLMRKGEWSDDFLDQAIQSSSILSVETALLPLRFENRAFLYLLGAWPTCVAMRRFDSLLAPVSRNARRFRRGVTTVDRCLINRRPRRATQMRHFFLNTGAGFDDIDDAFIGHAAGGGVVEKAKSMRQMLAHVAERQRTQAVSA